MAESRQEPAEPGEEAFDGTLRARSLAAVFIFGPVVASLTLAFPHNSDANETGQLAMAAGAFSLGILALVRGTSLPTWAMHLVLAAGNLLLTGFIYYSHDDNGIYSLFYAWLGLHAFYFFPFRTALLHVGLVAVSYGALLIEGDAVRSPVARWLVTVATPLLTGVVIAQLLSRLRAVAARADDRAERLERSEARMRQTLDTAHSAFISIDGDGRVTEWNPAAAATFGWSAQEAVGHDLAELIIPKPMRSAHHDGIARFLDTGEGRILNRRIELSGMHRDGHEVPVELTIAPVRSGDSWSFSAFLSDLSERRRLEEERAERLRQQTARSEAEALAGRVQRLQELTDLALAPLSVDRLLHDLLLGIREALDVDAGSILLSDPDSDSDELVVRATTERASADGPARVPLGQGFAGRVAAARGPLVLGEGGGSVALDPALRRSEIESVIGVPLMSGDEVIGVMHAGTTDKHRFGAEDVSLLELAAQRVSLAIERAHVFEREHRIAETLQRSLLPTHLPDSPVAEIAARYMPAASEAEVGGDWYDAVVLPGGEVVAALGDVEGKGLRAATLVGQLRSVFRAYVRDGHGCAAVAERLNSALVGERDDPQLATLCVLKLDPGRDLLTFALAGHLPPLVVTPSGEARYLEARGSMPLGAAAATPYGETEVELESGSAVVAFTDGLVERRDRSLEDGLELLRTAVSGTDFGPGEICDRALDTMLAGAPPGDDVAILAVCGAPLRGRLNLQLPATPASVTTVRLLLDRLLIDAAVDDDERYGIALATGEACANAVMHAYGPDGGVLEVEAGIEAGELTVVVRDHGAWRAEHASDAGRGRGLMETFMDSVNTTPTDDGTTVEMLRRVGGPVSGGIERPVHG